MKPFLVFGVALAIPALAQDKPSAAPPEDLPAFRAAFAAMPASGPAFAIACRKGSDPIILTAGNETGGRELSPESLAPLLGLAKVLAADAIATQCKHDIDKGSGEKLGDRELSVRELLEGTTLLPDYFVLDGSKSVANVATLRACGTMAVNAKLKLSPGSLGAAEFVLLEPLAFSGRHKDWQSMIRSTLAPHVGGIDPHGVDTLPEAAQARLPLASDDIANLAAAQPTLLRTVLTVRELATWWLWHSQQEVTASTSGRMGRLVKVPGHNEEQCWIFTCTALNSRVQGIHYPSQKAGLLLLVSSSTNTTKLRQAFEDVLFATATEEAARRAEEIARRDAQVAAVGARLRQPAQSAVPVAGLAGTRWVRASPADGSDALGFEFGKKQGNPLVLTIGGDTASLGVQSTSGDGFMATGAHANGVRQLWLWPQPNADKPTRLAVVMVTMCMPGMHAPGGSSSGPTSSVPQFEELVPAK
jgi:hypothetical protein